MSTIFSQRDNWRCFDWNLWKFLGWRQTWLSQLKPNVKVGQSLAQMWRNVSRIKSYAEIYYFPNDKTEDVLTDTLINFHDCHLTWLSQLKPNVKEGQVRLTSIAASFLQSAHNIWCDDSFSLRQPVYIVTMLPFQSHMASIGCYCAKWNSCETGRIASNKLVHMLEGDFMKSLMRCQQNCSIVHSELDRHCVKSVS